MHRHRDAAVTHDDKHPTNTTWQISLCYLCIHYLCQTAAVVQFSSTLKNLGSSKSQLKVQSWCERRQVHVETDEKEMLDFPVADQEKTLKGGLSRVGVPRDAF